MSLDTILGLLLGITLFIGSIALSTDDWVIFVSLESLMMVIGGTIAASYISYQARYVKLALIAITQIFKKPKMSRDLLNAEIKRIIKWSKLIQEKGLIALEEEARKVKDPLTKYGCTLVFSGYKPEDVRDMLETAIDAEFERNTVQVSVLKTMASMSPAFGMIGTLVGLVVMLQNLGGDMSQLGLGLAVALMTTLYGILFARMIFLPAALKLQQREDINYFKNRIIVEGFVLLSEKGRPRYIQDRLNSFLDPSIHFNIDKQMK